MKKYLFAFSLFFSLLSLSQLPYTENDFLYTVEANIEYGQAINYANQNDTLLLDIYKPLGDDNCTRPCLILIHGGSWIAGSKEDVNIQNIAASYAEKGWVVAAINYRLGTHKAPGYSMYAFCNDDISAPCGYICDSAEIYRANYRGQQDAKGAIRFMKNRGMIDSIDVNNVFVAGESAGAFIAYAATFLNQASEKSEFCEAITDAPNPDSDLIGCLPAGYSLSRPDLGTVQGNLNTGENDAKVQGVGSFYGAMMNFEMLEDESDWPEVYAFHQGSDVVVNYNYGRILGRIDWECYSPTNLCQNYARYPKAFGTKGIKTYLDGLAEGPVKTVDIIENYEYMNDCFDNGHSIDNWVLRSNNMAELFANRIAENGNFPNSGPCELGIAPNEINFSIYPNPSTGTVAVWTGQSAEMNLIVYSSDGKLILEKMIFENTELHLSPGIYFVHLFTNKSQQSSTQKLVVY